MNPMRFEGLIRKMESEAVTPLRYYQQLGGDFLYLNALIGLEIRFELTGTRCLNCGDALPIFARGFCRACFFSSPKAAESILRPELSRAHLGQEVRDLAWEKAFELQPHVVYLAFTDDVKVGVTRKSQLPLRWIDQGALQATVILETPNRYLAGITEVALKERLKDKTNWRAMLRTREVNADLLRVKADIKAMLPAETKGYWLSQDALYDFVYPLDAPPKRIDHTRRFDKEPHFKARLKGIKGQYLVFDDDTVLNIRAHEGYQLAFEV